VVFEEWMNMCSSSIFKDIEVLLAHSLMWACIVAPTVYFQAVDPWSGPVKILGTIAALPLLGLGIHLLRNG
jgi:hypothetical protein